MSADLPQSAFVKSSVVISGRAHGAVARAQVVLQERSGRRWKNLVRSTARSNGRFALHWRVPEQPGDIAVRLVVISRRRAFPGGSHVLRLRQLPLVLRPSEVSTVPAAGDAGWILLSSGTATGGRKGDAREASTCKPIPPGVANGLYPGNFVAMGYSQAHPDGYLGRIDFVGCHSGKDGLYASPVPLSEAYGNGPMVFKFANEVAGSSSASAGTAFSAGLPNLACGTGGSVSLTGSFSVDAKPELDASFSGFKLSSASFIANGTATASLTFHAHGTTGCAPSPVTTNPVRLATFEGQVGPFPVVVVLEGQISVDASISAAADASGTVSVSGSLTGGVSYANGRFRGIAAKALSVPPASFTVNGEASASGSIQPTVTALLYGVAGPSLSLKAGIDVTANPGNPATWSANAPLEIDASFDASKLGITNDPSFPIMTHTFPLASGVFGSRSGNGPTGGNGSLGAAGGSGNIPGPSVPPASTQGVAWTANSPSGNVIALTDHGVLVCGGASDSDRFLQSLTDAGETRWTSPPSDTQDSCGAAVGDADGNTYVVEDPGGSPELNSYTSTGALRWSTPLQGYPEEIRLGADGNLYIAEEIGVGWQIFGYSGQTGGATGFHVTAGGSGQVGLATYAGGVVASDASGATYYTYAGDSVASYNTGLSDEGYSYASGENGLVFIGGWDGGCHPTVEAITPQGVQWAYHDSTAGTKSCNGQTGLVATPGGGVVLQKGLGWSGDCQADNSDFVSLAPDGTQEWSKGVSTPTGYQDATPANCFLAIADTNGTVVIAENFTYTCPAGPNACSGIAFNFVNDKTGESAAAPYAQTDDSGDWWLGTSPAVNQAYDAITSDSGDLIIASYESDHIAGVPIPGLGTDYRLEIQEQTQG